MRRPKILLLAYMISPHRGSEYAVAWNHVTWMSEHCELTVLYGAAGPHMGDFDEVSVPAAAERLPGVRFVPVRPPVLARCLNAANRKGWLTYTFYLAYRSWHAEAGRVARRLVDEESFDVVHYLGPIGYREPGVLWRLGLPYVWGPFGGATHLPAALARALPWSGRLKLGFRAVANWFQLRCSVRLRRALARADVLLTATTENQAIFRRVLGVDTMYLPENGIVGEVTLNETKFVDVSRIRLIWIGSVEPRKALRVLVDAMANMRHAARLEVHVVGDGPLRAGLQEAVARQGMAAQFVWHGQVGRDVVQSLLSQAHLHVVTSVSEGNPTTVWEAMVNGVPTITIDHCGMHDTVRDSAGLKVPVGPYPDVVAGFAHHLDALVEQPSRLQDMARQVLADADAFHWRRRSAFWLSRYAEAAERHAQRQRLAVPGSAL